MATWRWTAPVRAAGLLVLLAAPGGPGAVARADEFDTKDLSLRLPAALTRFASYGDVAGAGGASAGSKWSSGVNPASSAWLPPPGDLRLSFTPQYSNLYFSEGTVLHVTSEALTWDLGRAGTIQPALAQVHSNRETTRQGLDFRLDMDYGQVQWAKKVADAWAFGANFAKAKTQFDLDRTAVSDSTGETYGFRFGALHRLADKVLGGAVVEYAFSKDRTTLFDFLGLGVGNTHIHDTTHQVLLRPGLSFEYRKDSCLYADYQYGVFRNDTGRLRVHRFPMGVDHSVCKWLFVRGGVMLDTRGHASWTTGVGVYPTKRLAVDVAYQADMFAELEPELGRSNTLTISVSLSF